MNINEALEVADHDIQYGNVSDPTFEDYIAACQTLATAYREAMTLRPMEESPCDEDVLVLLPGGSWEIERGDDYKYQRAAGWLPLPTPINEGEL